MIRGLLNGNFLRQTSSRQARTSCFGRDDGQSHGATLGVTSPGDLGRMPTKWINNVSINGGTNDFFKKESLFFCQIKSDEALSNCQNLKACTIPQSNSLYTRGLSICRPCWQRVICITPLNVATKIRSVLLELPRLRFGGHLQVDSAVLSRSSAGDHSSDWQYTGTLPSLGMARV